MMKKSLILALAFCFVLIGWSTCFAQDVNIGEVIEKAKKEASVEDGAKESRSLETLRKSLDAVKKNSASRQSSDWIFSTNPLVLQPMVGTVWGFAYTVADEVWIDVITFATTIQTLSDGSVALACQDQYGNQGALLYDLDVEFVIILPTASLDQSYIFSISGEEASGVYYVSVPSMPGVEDIYPMAGIIRCSQATINAACQALVAAEQQACQGRIDAAVAAEQQTCQGKIDAAVAAEQQTCQGRIDAAVAAEQQTCQGKIDAAVATVTCDPEQICQEQVDNAVAAEQETCQKQMGEAVTQERKRWDANDDDRLGLPEALRALKVSAGETETP